jgi:hypothetical protein
MLAQLYPAAIDPNATFASDIFGPFNAIDQGGLNTQGAGVHPGDVIYTNVAVDPSGNLITGGVVQSIDPLSGQIINSPAPPVTSQPGLLDRLESDFGGAANFTLILVGLVAAIVIVPRILSTKK